MAVTNIPNVTNWSVTPQNGQAGYFLFMNTWLSESTAVIASLQTAITAQNTANSEINDLAIQVADNATDAQNARDEAVSAIAILSSGAIDDTTIANNKAYSNQKTNDLLEQKVDKNISSYASKTTPIDADLIPLSDSVASFGIKKLSWANIKVTLKTYFDTLYTVASSETTSGIIELATTAEAQNGTDDLRAITPLKLKNSVLGLGQTWQDLTASRVLNTTYTNSTGKPIQLAIDITVLGSTISTLTIGANTFFYRGSLGTAVSHTIELIVQNGVTYNLSSSNTTLNKWQELR